MSAYQKRDYKGRFTKGVKKKSSGLKLVSKRKLTQSENLIFYGGIALVLVLIGFGLVIQGLGLGLIAFLLLGYVSKKEAAKAADQGIFDVYKSTGAMVRCTHFKSWVAGLEYNGIAHVADKIRVDDVLDIEREPENRYDTNAIGVWFQGIQIGHLTREFALSFHKQMDRGDILEVRVTYFNPQSSAYDRLRIDLIDKTYQKEQGKSILQS